MICNQLYFWNYGMQPDATCRCQNEHPGVCFTNVSRAIQNILTKFVNRKNRTSGENFKVKLCTCAQSHALGTRTKFRLEILTINVISGMLYFRDII